jgi:hypothetical protein
MSETLRDMVLLVEDEFRCPKSGLLHRHAGSGQASERDQHQW